MKRTKPLKRGKPIVRRAAMSRMPAADGAAFWRRQALACKERDDWRCRRCGDATQPVLAAAHVVPLGIGGSRYKANDPRNALDNLKTLCFPCHALKDEQHGWTWASIGVTPDPALALRYGYRETVRLDSKPRLG